MSLLLTKKQAAAELGVPESTLDNWRYTGTGPNYVKLPKEIKYAEADLVAWIGTLTVIPVAEQVAHM